MGRRGCRRHGTCRRRALALYERDGPSALSDIRVQPETLAALIVRFATYAACALGLAAIVHARSRGAPLVPAFAVLLAGIALTAALRALVRAQLPAFAAKTLRPHRHGMEKKDSALRR